MRATINASSPALLCVAGSSLLTVTEGSKSGDQHSPLDRRCQTCCPRNPMYWRPVSHSVRLATGLHDCLKYRTFSIRDTPDGRQYRRQRSTLNVVVHHFLRRLAQVCLTGRSGNVVRPDCSSDTLTS
ncbi:hypothetical protein OH76DRAFT_724522 [Lentinus brumalis]|uniref:Secreted protein n=1 Tax=Lentinus brumalis TaxID=2498619 RepID=A0A371D528_9APHY|nr:hypothetical protein OH76DRAFT_724522 [Polyporus brumalis]